MRLIFLLNPTKPKYLFLIGVTEHSARCVTKKSTTWCQPRVTSIKFWLLWKRFKKTSRWLPVDQNLVIFWFFLWGVEMKLECRYSFETPKKCILGIPMMFFFKKIYFQEKAVEPMVSPRWKKRKWIRTLTKFMILETSKKITWLSPLGHF